VLGRYSVQTERFKLVVSRLPPYERLYDLEQDPTESEDVGSSHPGEVERHRALLARYLRDAETERPEDEPATAVGPDPEAAAQLRALGYLE
jgi:hypothetical protein